MCRSIFAMLCLLTVGASNIHAQTTSEPGPIGREMEDRIVTAVAERWRVDPGRVVLQWSRVAEGLAIDSSTQFDVRGRVTGTNFTVVFSNKDRPPVAVGLRVGLQVIAPLAAHPLPSGHIVQDGDVVWGDWVRWGDDVHDPVIDKLPVGWRTRTSIAAGNLVAQPSATPPPAVRAGATIQVLWRKRLVVVSVFGVAMHDASIGQHVRVRLEGGRGTIRGVVHANGHVDLIEN